MPASLEENMAVYEKLRAELEQEHRDQWVLIYDLNVIGIFATFEEAALRAADNFGRGPYHIRQIGVDIELSLPAAFALNA